MKKRRFLAILGLSTLALTGCDVFDNLPFFGNNVESLTNVSKSKQRELINSVDNVGATSYYLMSTIGIIDGETQESLSPDYSQIAKDKYKETTIENCEEPGKSIFFTKEHRVESNLCKIELIGEDIFFNGEPIPKDSPLYNSYYKGFSDEAIAKYYTFSAIDTLVNETVDVFEELYPTGTVSLTREQFIEKTKIENKKNKSTFSLVIDEDFYFTVGDATGHIKYLSLEYEDYKLVSEIMHMYVQVSFVEQGQICTIRTDYINYVTFAYNVNADTFLGN